MYIEFEYLPVDVIFDVERLLDLNFIPITQTIPAECFVQDLGT